MIHEVRLPRENRIYLWQIVHLQLDVLSCAAALAPGFTEQDLQGALEQKMPLERSNRVAKWVCGHKETREGLQTFVADTGAERQTLVESMCDDVLRLFWARRNESLQCCFDGNAQSYQNGAKQFLIAFYEQLSSGVPANLLLHNPCKYPKYGREQFFQLCERDNPNQYICAICDEHRPITVLRGSYLSDIEHYFPKSIYPHLACHPYNLIPICRACNSAHSDRDPLTPRNGGAQRTLDEIFLPYRQESVRLHGLVKFEWGKLLSPSLSIEERTSSTTFSSKLTAFAEIYDIPERWQKRIDSIGEQLWRQMSAYIRAEIDKEESLDPFKIKTALERLLAYFIEDLGANPWDFVLVWYLSHLLVADLESAIQNNSANIPLVETLEEIVRTSKSKTSSVLSVDEVLEASRQTMQSRQA
jgi:hypothetical protein